jgi:hypothetical protein
MSHTCHAIDCTEIIKPEMLMCKVHWYMVPYLIRKRVWDTYRPGQCDDWEPSEEYCNAAKSAVMAVAHKERKVFDELHPNIAMYNMFTVAARKRQMESECQP